MTTYVHDKSGRGRTAISRVRLNRYSRIGSLDPTLLRGYECIGGFNSHDITEYEQLGARFLLAVGAEYWYDARRSAAHYAWTFPPFRDEPALLWWDATGYVGVSHILRKLAWRRSTKAEREIWGLLHRRYPVLLRETVRMLREKL